MLCLELSNCFFAHSLEWELTHKECYQQISKFLPLRNARNSIQSETSPNIRNCKKTRAIIMPLSAPQVQVINVISSCNKISDIDSACFHHPVCMPACVVQISRCEFEDCPCNVYLGAHEVLLSVLAELVILYVLIMAASAQICTCKLPSCTDQKIAHKKLAGMQNLFKESLKEENCTFEMSLLFSGLILSFSTTNYSSWKMCFI